MSTVVEFVRPIRYSYTHIGKKHDVGIEMLEIPIFSETDSDVYIALTNIEIDGKIISKAYTQEELNQYIKSGVYVGGCGIVTTMNTTLAEMYARDPFFCEYIYCTGCQTHLPVQEFIWEKSKHQVGT